MAGLLCGLLPSTRTTQSRRDWPMATVDARQGLHDEFGEYTPKNLAQSKKLKLIMIAPEIVVESIVVNPDNNRYSYFGAHK